VHGLVAAVDAELDVQMAHAAGDRVHWAASSSSRPASAACITNRVMRSPPAVIARTYGATAAVALPPHMGPVNLG